MKQGDLFCEDINMRAADYANRNAPQDVGRWIWQKIADAYVAGARAQQNIINKEQCIIR